MDVGVDRGSANATRFLTGSLLGVDGTDDNVIAGRLDSGSLKGSSSESSSLCLVGVFSEYRIAVSSMRVAGVELRVKGLLLNSCYMNVRSDPCEE